MSLTTARKQLAAALRKELGRAFVFVTDGTLTVDQAPTKPTVQLFRTNVIPHPAAPRSGRRRSTFALQLIAPSNATDDQLEGWLDELLDAIDKVTDIVWESADRGVWPATDPTNPAYSIPFTRTTE